MSKNIMTMNKKIKVLEDSIPKRERLEYVTEKEKLVNIINSQFLKIEKELNTQLSNSKNYIDKYFQDNEITEQKLQDMQKNYIFKQQFQKLQGKVQYLKKQFNKLENNLSKQEEFLHDVIKSYDKNVQDATKNIEKLRQQFQEVTWNNQINKMKEKERQGSVKHLDSQVQRLSVLVEQLNEKVTKIGRFIKKGQDQFRNSLVQEERKMEEIQKNQFQ